MRQTKKQIMGISVKLKSEMARAYGISIYTLRKWLKELGIKNKGQILTSKEITQLEQEYGEPDYSLITPKPIGNA